MNKLLALLIKLTQFGRRARVLLYRRLAAFTRDGVPVADALKLLQQRYRASDDNREHMLSDWLGKMRAGQPFTHAMSGWAPPQELVMLLAGEAAGNLEKGLSQTAWLSENAGKIVGAVIGAVTYPITIFLGIGGLIAWFAVTIIPTFAEALPPDKWSGGPLALYTLSVYITGYWHIMLAFAVALVSAFVISLPRWTGWSRELVDNYPPYAIYRLYQSAVFLVSLSTMVQAGIPINEALERIKYTAPAWLKVKLDLILRRISAGSAPGKAMMLPMFDKETLDDLFVYSSVSSFDEAIAAIGNRSIEDTIASVKRLATQMNAVLLMLSAGTLGWIYLSVFELTDLMRSAST